MKCPSCGAENQTGKFCAECGAGLDVNCASCGTGVPPGSRFCTSCGEAVAAGSGAGQGWAGGSRAGWIFAAGAAVVVLLVLFLPREADRVPAPPRSETGAPFTGSIGGDAGPGELSSDMRTNADRLFNRIMTAAEQGNQAEVEQFTPMAIQAYGMVEDLDEDGLYHLATLQVTAGEYADARATAQRILDRSPDHILALGVAATAAEEAGDSTAARGLWDRLLDAYPAEADKPLPEYVDHQAMLTEFRRAAREATGRQ